MAIVSLACAVLLFHMISVSANTIHNNHTMGGHNNHTMGGHNNHTMGGHNNHTMDGHNNHTMGGHNNHTMGGHKNHTMGGHKNHTTDHGSHGKNGSDHSSHGNNGSDHGSHGNNESDHGSHGNNGSDKGSHGNSGNNHKNHGTTRHSAGHGTHFFVSEYVTLFFEEWVSDSSKDFTVMCIVMGLLGILYEGFKLCRQYLTGVQVKVRRSMKYNKVASGDVEFKRNKTLKEVGLHLLQMTIHIVNIFIGYLLMLAFMTFNTYLCISVLAGFALGYLIFGWVLPGQFVESDPDSSCH